MCKRGGSNALRRYAKILVTGGAGFIGSHLIDRLLQGGYEVTALDNFSSGKIENIRHHTGASNFHLMRGDIRNLRNVEKAVEDADAVFHLAAIVSVPLSVKEPSLVKDVNVGGTLNLLEASLDADVKRFVYASSCAVYGEASDLPIDERHPTAPLSPYAASKLAAEHHCRFFHEDYGFETVCLRYFNAYGPRQKRGSYGGVITQFINRIKQGKPPIIYGDGSQTRDFVHIDDVAEASELAMHRRGAVGEVFNIGTGKATTINQLAQILTKLVGKPELKPVYTNPRLGDIKHSQANISKAQTILGYIPKIGLEHGLKALLSHMRVPSKNAFSTKFDKINITHLSQDCHKWC